MISAAAVGLIACLLPAFCLLDAQELIGIEYINAQQIRLTDDDAKVF